MKKIMVLFALATIVLLSACEKGGDVLPECTDTQELKNGVCVEKEPEECNDGYELVNGECKEIVDPVNPLIAVFENSIGMDNYTMEVSITEGDVSVVLELFFEDNESLVSVDETNTYFLNTGDGCYRYVFGSTGYVEETIDCIEETDTRYGFFHSFEVDWFEEVNGDYALKTDYYTSLNNFFRTELDGAVVSNFVLETRNDYFDVFTFTVTAGDAVFDFVIEFDDINETNVDIPTVQ